MDTRRWLLPFTWNVDMQAIDAAIRLAEGGAVTLVAVSLIARPDVPTSRKVRLEHLQQSKDFLEAVRWKAARFNVPIERHEVFTVEAMQSITALTHELHCEAIVLVSRGEREALLHAHQLKHLLAEPPASLLVLRLSARTEAERQSAKHIGARLLRWLYQCEERLKGVRADWDTLELAEPLWVRTEEHRRG